MNRGSWKWRRAEAVLYREVLDDVVILVPGPDEPEPFALAGGAALWRLLAQPRTSEELLAALTVGFAAPQGDTELDGLLAQLAGAGAVDRMPT